PGNQGGNVVQFGMDFNVLSPISVSSLGVFDSGQDGFLGTITVSIYNRLTQTVVPGLSLAISGLQGTLNVGDRLVLLSSPVILPAGFQGSIVTDGLGNPDASGSFSFRRHAGDAVPEHRERKRKTTMKRVTSTARILLMAGLCMTISALPKAANAALNTTNIGSNGDWSGQVDFSWVSDTVS